MTVLIGDVKDIGLRPTEGTVTVFSARTRRANGAGGVITRERRDYPLSGGRFRTGELDPGRTTVELVAPGVFETWTFDLPADGTVSLVDAVELSVDYSPDSAVVNGAAAAAAKAERWAGEAAGSAAVAGRARDAAVQAQASVSRVVESAVTVVRGEFTDLTDRAESAAVRAEQARDAAASSAEGAAGSVAAAEASAGEAAGSASAAGESAGRAEGSAKAAEGYASAAESSAGAAESLASAARSSADAAASSLGDVNTAVSTATAARTGAELARDEAVHAAESAKTGAPVGGWDVGSLSQGVRESLGRADSAITVVPTATASSAGAVKLAGDLAGTWDAPTVPGLADKADAAVVEQLMWRMKAAEVHDVFTLKSDTNVKAQFEEELSRRGLDPKTVTVLPFKIDATQVTRLDYLCSEFLQLRVAPTLLNTGKVTSWYRAFHKCSELVFAPSFDTSGANDIGEMFSYCSSLTHAPELNTGSVTNFSGMFSHCSSLVSVPDMNASKGGSFPSMFYNCKALKDGSVRLIRSDGSKPKSIYRMIENSGLSREPFFTPDGQPIN